MRFFLISLMLLASIGANAEVYRWTDSNGKVHFGDKKPAEKAEDISDKVKQQNIDTSSGERQKLETIFRKENEADREYKRQQAQPSTEQIQRCEKAREYLKKISGRVQYLDDNGKPVHVTMEEHKKNLEETQKFVRENCSE